MWVKVNKGKNEGMGISFQSRNSKTKCEDVC